MANLSIAVLTNDPDLSIKGTISHELKKDFNVITHREYLRNPEKYNDKIEAVLFNPLHHHFTKEDLQKCANLKVIHTPSTGIEHVIKFVGKDVRVSNAPSVYGKSTADVAFGLLISSSRLFTFEKTNIRMMRGVFNSQDVHNSVLGIYGMGNLGFEVAKRAALGFDMTVLYHNRTRRSVADEESVHATYCSSLDEMLPQVDHVVITAPLTPQTHHAFGARQFELMKNTATIVNVGRGPVINTEALVEALQNGQIHAAGLDVTDPEPLPDGHPLWSMPNVFITPHQGALSVQSLQNVYKNAVENISAGIAGKPMPNEVFLKS